MAITIRHAYIAGLIVYPVAFIALILSVAYEFMGKSTYTPLFLVLQGIVTFVGLITLLGFVRIGEKSGNDAVRNITYLLIGFSFIVFFIIILAGSKELSFMQAAAITIVEGILSVLFGYSLLTLKQELGSPAKVAGILNIIIGVSVMTIIFAFLIVLLYIPMAVFEMIMLDRANKKWERRSGKPVRAAVKTKSVKKKAKKSAKKKVKK